MSATIVRESTMSPAKSLTPRESDGLNGYVAHVAKQLAKSGKLADMLNGGTDLVSHVDPAAREELIKIAKAVRYALAQGKAAQVSAA